VFHLTRPAESEFCVRVKNFIHLFAKVTNCRGLGNTNVGTSAYQALRISVTAKEAGKLHNSLMTIEILVTFIWKGGDLQTGAFQGLRKAFPLFLKTSLFGLQRHTVDYLVVSPLYKLLTFRELLRNTVPMWVLPIGNFTRYFRLRSDLLIQKLMGVVFDLICINVGRLGRT